MDMSQRTDQRPALASDPRHTALLAVALVAIGLLVTAFGSYGMGWQWTGFRGNKLWDWLNLLVLPFAVPVAFLWIGFRLEDERRDEQDDERATQPG
jgi:hypothetical protein